MSVIKPTRGRIVWFTPAHGDIDLSAPVSGRSGFVRGPDPATPPALADLATDYHTAGDEPTK